MDFVDCEMELCASGQEQLAAWMSVKVGGMRDEITRLRGESGVLRALLMEAHKWLEVVINDDDMDIDERNLMAQLSGKIDAALKGTA